MLPARLRLPLICLPFLLVQPAWGTREIPVGQTASPDRLPNIVVIFIDDLGYADIGPFGADAYPTPNLDQMAREGRTFTDFVASSAVCSASRIALMTGCLHARLGMHGALGPGARIGIHPDELTLAELCRQKGYATACFGKWHLGLQKPFLPLQHGFDEYYGLPYSNDMWPYHPDYAELPTLAEKRKRGYPDLPLIEGNEVVDPEVTGDDQKGLTAEYTRRAVDFIERQRDRPFFLYVPHTMVHVPLFVSERFAGKSGAGLFGDVMMEVDWSVGEILQAIRDHDLQDNTLVVFTSDNGPWLSYGEHAGSARPLREGKGTMFEGGYRVPTVMWWPGRIPAGTTCPELASTIDLLPTVARWIEGQLPDHPIDGKDITPLIFAAEDARSPHDAFPCYYGGGELRAIRDRRWKLHFPHSYRTLNGRPGGKNGSPAPYEQAQIGLELFDLQQDPGESRDVAAQHPAIVSRLLVAAEKARAEMGDKLQDRKGNAIRPPARLPEKPGDHNPSPSPESPRSP